MTKNNPLLIKSILPPFDVIKVEDMLPALKYLLNKNRRAIKKLLAQKYFTWDNLIAPLEELDDALQQMWAPISQLHATMNSPELRTVYQSGITKLTTYYAALGQNEALYAAVKSIADSHVYQQLNAAQQKVITNKLRDFKLAGVALTASNKKKFAKLQQKLSRLTTKFAHHVLDATDAWHYVIIDEKMLSGLPAHTIAAARNADQQGWRLSLQYPVYDAVMKHADNQELRRVMYHAYVTRASDLGQHSKKIDNSSVMEEILSVRHTMAQLIGLDNFAEYSLATKMAETPQQVLDFLYDLLQYAKPAAEKEFAELKQFAKLNFGVDELQAWDVAYYSEKLREAHHKIAQEQLRPYFQENEVLNTLFHLIEQLFSFTIKEEQTFASWHKDVRLFAIYRAERIYESPTDFQGKKAIDPNILVSRRGGEEQATGVYNQYMAPAKAWIASDDANKAESQETKDIVGYFYADLYARPDKNSGAWMDTCRSRRSLPDGTIQLPVAYLNCNFSVPHDNQPSLLTHDEISTLCHELGHCLHHLLTQVDYAEVSGINGVAWDAVELPSQWLENFCWQKEVIKLFAKHYKTGELLAEEWLDNLIASKNFQTALAMVRQLIFALFDFRLYYEYDFHAGSRIQIILDEVRKHFSVVPTPSFNRFQHSFSHIFAGGYAAGYYSYKWAEVLSSDAFAKFKEQGIFDKATGEAFLNSILANGGARDAMELFIQFRGRPPKIDALLEDCGIKL